MLAVFVYKIKMVGHYLNLWSISMPNPIALLRHLKLIKAILMLAYDFSLPWSNLAFMVGFPYVNFLMVKSSALLLARR